MFWKRKQGFILIFHDRIEFLLEGSSAPSVFPFPTPVVHNLELIDQIGFEKSFKEFLEREKVFQLSITTILDESFLFWKKLAPEMADTDFFDRIPLPLDQQIHKQILVGTDRILSAHNSAILESIQRILHVKKNIVVSLLPFFAFPAFENGQIDSMNIDMTSVRKVCRYNSEILKFKSTSPLLSTLPLIGIIVLLMGGIGLILWFQQPKRVAKTIVKKQVRIPTPTPTIVFLNPKDIRIDIKNGSGRFGEAGRLKTKLEKESYTILTVGNSDNDIQNTEIISKITVPADFIASLSALLEKDYQMSASSSPILEATQSADIVITIGTDLAQ